MTRKTLFGSALLAGALMSAAMMIGATGIAAAQTSQSAHSENQGLRITSTDFALTYTAERTKIAPSNCGCFWLNGGSGDAAATFFKGLGIAANLTLNHASDITPGVNLSQFILMAGPRYTYNTSRWTDRRFMKKHDTYLFGEWLLGGVHAYNSVFPTSTGTTPSASAFSMQVGGGANVALTKGFGLRLLELDYVRTTLPNNGSNSQNDLRIAFGVSYRPKFPHK